MVSATYLAGACCMGLLRSPPCHRVGGIELGPCSCWGAIFVLGGASMEAGGGSHVVVEIVCESEGRVR